MKRTCIVNNDFGVRDLFTAVMRATPAPPFDRQLAAFLGADTCLLTSCGFAALEVILAALQDMYPGKSEVIMPAYTAPGLVLPLRRRGLTPVLCDISLETFTMDPARIGDVMSASTLAIVAVDLFGIPADIPSLRKAAGPDVPIIDDCAQALGSERAGVKAGMAGDIGFGSFGRGKNFSVYTGGCIALRASRLSTFVMKHFARLPASTASAGILSSMKSILFSAVTSPVIYHYAAPLLARVKRSREQCTFSSAALNAPAATYARRLFPLWRTACHARMLAGTAYRELLMEDDGLLMPAMAPDTRIAFNRFPILVRHPARRETLLARLRHAGIDASPLYEKPVHCLHAVPVPAHGYPAAEYFARHLLTLPAHGQVSQDDVGRVADIFRATRTEAEGQRE